MSGKDGAEAPIPIVCDCHGTEILAMRRGNALVIRDRRHGEHHVVSLPIVVDSTAREVVRLGDPEF